MGLRKRSEGRFGACAVWKREARALARISHEHSIKMIASYVSTLKQVLFFFTVISTECSPKVSPGAADSFCVV